MKRVVFTTYGSLGDLYPFLAIAQELRDRGVECAFVTNHSNLDALEGAGFEAHGIVTDAIHLFENAGLQGEAAVEATGKSIARFWRIVMPEFAAHLGEIDAIVGDASAIVGPAWAFNGQSVAEKKTIPYVGAHLWPLGVPSAYDPPVIRDIPGLIRKPKTTLTIAWNRFVIGVAKQVMRLMFAKYLNPPRASYGLGRLSRTPVLDFQLEPALVLGLYSPHFSPRTADMPPELALTGFPLIKDEANEPDPELDGFMDGEPIVFTLGSILSENPGSFYEASIEAAQRLGKRALILSNKPILEAPPNDVLLRGYVPHSKVFPKAKVIVHHGGIGTTARALKAGKPQLVVPHFGDQPDNAARLAELGVASLLSSDRYTASSAASALADILSSDIFSQRAVLLAAQIQSEDGASNAATSIFDLIA
jgi:rhamnosyltransferase subunit B